MDKARKLKPTYTAFRKALRANADAKKAKDLQWFFKTGKGEYGEGDRFLGVTVPMQRKILKNFLDLSLTDLSKLLKSAYHEERLSALLIAVGKFKKGSLKTKKEIALWYLQHTKYIDNWDLVDSSAGYIIGEYAATYDKQILNTLAHSRNLWEKRIAMIATLYFITKGSAKEAIAVATKLRNDEHDLIQKAVGWMLREVGKRVSRAHEEAFLEKYAATLPRTTLRYAIEHFSPTKKQYYMNKKLTKKVGRFTLKKAKRKKL
jgi:3-methyladenine DNA glycosylase AlkD